MYIDQFGSWADVQSNFRITMEEPETVFVAAYDTPGYEGYAIVLYSNNGKYYWVQGSHCSCMGLEHQFDPTEYGSYEIFLKVVEGYNFNNFSLNKDDIVATIVRHGHRFVPKKPIIEI